jgi:dynein heavy chain
VESWLQLLDAAEYRPILAPLFDKYVEATLEHCARKFRTVVPLPAVSQAQTLCKILDGLLPKASWTDQQ